MHRSAKTRFDVIVACMLLFFVGGLMIVVISRVRMAMTRTNQYKCLKFCALATHSYHDTHKRMPDGFAPDLAFKGESVSVWRNLLPFLEESVAFRSGDPAASIWQFQAEADPSLFDLKGTLNLAANLRIFAHKTFGEDAANSVGVAFEAPEIAECGLRLKDIKDGTTNTILFGTRYSMCDDVATVYLRGPRDTPRGGFFGAGQYLAVPESSEANGLDLTFQRQPQIHDCRPEPGIYGQSFFFDGIALATADGSVRFVKWNISPETFSRAMCPGDQNPLGHDWSE